MKVRFLNGDLVEYPNSNRLDMVNAIAESEQVHPLQVRLLAPIIERCEQENEYDYDALILPKKTIVMSDYLHLFSPRIPNSQSSSKSSHSSNPSNNEKNERFEQLSAIHEDIVHLDLATLTHESVLKYLFRVFRTRELPNALLENPHPICVTFWKDLGWFEVPIIDEMVRLVTDTTPTTQREVGLVTVSPRVFSNPSDVVVEALLTSSLYRERVCTTSLLHHHSNPNPRIAQYLYERYRALRKEVGVDDHNAGCIACVLLEHPGSNPEMINDIVSDLPGRLVRIELHRILNRRKLRETVGWSFSALYQRWVHLPEEVRDYNIWIPFDTVEMNWLLHEKRYSELFAKYGENPDTHVNVFTSLSDVGDDEAVVEWLMNATNARFRENLTLVCPMLRNPHPRVVEWLLTHSNSNVCWAVCFSRNRHPLAVAKTVEWWLDGSSKTTLPDNPDAVIEILAKTRENGCGASGLQVTRADFLRSVVEMGDDVEIVLD